MIEYENEILKASKNIEKTKELISLEDTLYLFNILNRPDNWKIDNSILKQIKNNL